VQSSARSRQPGRARLDRERVVRAAADLVNAEGAAALTINRLAQELGIQPPSLYNHIDGLADLQRALALFSTRALGERITAAVIGKSGPAGVMAMAEAYRGYIREFPGLYLASLRASGNLDTPDPELKAAEESAVRVTLALMDAFGLSGADAIHAVRGLRSAVHGFATLEAAGGFGIPLDLDESFRRLIGIVIQGLEQGKDSKEA
jgi:AcrR family transcriptional regulator